MRTAYEESTAAAREIERQLSRGTTKLSRHRFGPVAKFLWPQNTAAHVAAIAGRNVRTAERWLAGEFEPPFCVIAATMNEIFGAE
jgi:hypothetical protein